MKLRNYILKQICKLWKQKEWGKRVGMLEVKYLNEIEITGEKLLARNKDWYDKQPKEQKAE